MSGAKELFERLRAREETGYAKPVGRLLSSEITRMDNGTLVRKDAYEGIEQQTRLRNPDGPEAAGLLERQAEAAGKLVEALERVVSDCGLAYNSLGNSGPEFASVQRGFSIIEYRARQALREYHEAHHGN